MPEFVWERFVTAADAAVDRYLARTDVMSEWVDSGLLFSDGFCFCVLCEMFGVDHIVEGGTGYGGSTEMFARYFESGTCVKSIWSVDDAVNPLWQRPLALLAIRHYSRSVWSTEKQAKQIARERRTPFANVRLLRGDANRKLPRLVSRLARDGARVGVLLDGPKGDEQMRLAERLLRECPAVAFAALDDIGPMFDIERRGERFRASRYAAFATSDRAFFDRYAWINRGRLPARMIGAPGHVGYGLGILINGRESAR